MTDAFGLAIYPILAMLKLTTLVKLEILNSNIHVINLVNIQALGGWAQVSRPTMLECIN